MSAATPLADEPLWYKDAIIYEVRVRAFYDSNGDGIGDFPGLTSKLDYLQELGVTALWLLPFYPSPLRDDGYDISSYTEVHPECGTLADFRVFLREAHRRGLRVITELVLNHTSDQHAWFQRARHAKPGSRYRDFYVWSDTPDRYQDVRIIFEDFETSNWQWDPVAKQYYWHRFFSHQPDLNFDNPQVGRAMLQVLDFWLNLGVDGVRLDAVPYLFEREGTNGENLPETHDFLKTVRRHVERKHRNKMLLAEANQWPEDAVAYFGAGDECHMAFHFPVMPRMFMAIQMEERTPIVDIFNETPPIPETCQWALFLRNHDELTLEMVTDEERDYMYRVYAHDPQARVNLGIRRRLAPLLNSNRRRIELMNGLLLSLPGTPVLYYGDEIGMGDNIYLGDRNSVRTPMQWSADRNAGFSRANPQLLYLPIVSDPEYSYETINVETQSNNANSLLWWTKRLIALRKAYAAFGRGTITFLAPQNGKVLAYLRRHEHETILVVANLSRFVQHAELDLSSLRGAVPVEMFGMTPFPEIGETPYGFTLGAHDFYWFLIQSPSDSGAEVATGRESPPLTLTGPWPAALQGSSKGALERILPGYLAQRRWFGGKGRKVRRVEVAHVLPVPGHESGVLLLVNVAYTEGALERYQLTLAFSEAEQAERVRAQHGRHVVAELTLRDARRTRTGVLHEALTDPDFATTLVDMIARGRRRQGETATVAGIAGRGLRALVGRADLEPRLLDAEQSNSALVYGNELILKVFRRVDDGINPDVEVGQHLAERRFPHSPAMMGQLALLRNGKPAASLAILHRYTPHQGDAWTYTLDELSRYFERVLALGDQFAMPPTAPALLEDADVELGERTRAQIGQFLGAADLLGQRTGEMHVALAQGSDEGFAPEPFSTLYQRSLSQAFRGQATQALALVRRHQHTFRDDVAQQAQALLACEAELRARLRRIAGNKLAGQRTRTHGDYHLGQVLYTGRDFLIIDYEGEPARAIGERRIKRSPIRDVAGMLRSFDYAVRTAQHNLPHLEDLTAVDAEHLAAWATLWRDCVSWAFLSAYRAAVRGSGIIPAQRGQLSLLLDVYLLEKALYELAYELNHRPDWVDLPLAGLLALLERPPA